MSPSEKFRALLDERGIKWWYGIGEKSTVFDGEYGVRYEVDGTLGLLFIRSVLNVTPEMAVAATVGTEPDEATMLKLHDRMNAALLDYESAMGIKGGNGANTVPFVIKMHSLLEEAATMGARGTCKDLGGVSADDEVVFNCSECGCVLSVFDKNGRNNLCMSYIDDYPRFCPECGARIIKEATE